MAVGFIVALVIAIPVILFPVAYVWYLNIGGLIKLVRKEKATEKEHKAAAAKQA